MKTIKLVLFSIALGFGHSQAQVNLVPNPSFEILDSCPDGLSQINRVKPWFSRCESPDYFNACDTIINSGWDNTGVPMNTFGFQFPFNGTAYSGIHVYNNAREYLSVRLDSDLVIGTKYFLSMRICLAIGPNTQLFKNATNNQGMLLSLDSLPLQSPINYSTINNSIIISDSTDWTLIQGSTIADSSYKFLTIGNFFDDNLTLSSVFQPNGITNYSYYYVDYVCVSTDSSVCSSIVSNDEIEFLNKNQASVYPNPASNTLFFKNVIINDRYYLYNLLGEQIMIGNVNNSMSIEISSLTPGIYLIFLESSQKSFHFLKI